MKGPIPAWLRPLPGQEPTLDALVRDLIAPRGESWPRRPNALGELLDAAYPDPDGGSAESLIRSQHLDIAHLSDEALDRERVACTLRHAFTAFPSGWLLSRRAALTREAARRQQRGARA